MKRDAFTLTELLAAMAVVSIVMGITAMLLVKLFDYQQNNYEYSEQRRATDRFITEFRNDVHTYGKPQILADGTVLLRWTTNTETIEYTAQPGEFPDQRNIVRTVRKESGNRYETYRLPDRSALRFAEGTANDAGLVALSLWTTPPGTKTPNLDELNPFDRTIPESLAYQIDPKYASNWRTIIVRY